MIAAAPGTLILRTGSTLAARPDLALAPGDCVQAGGTATLRGADGSRLVLDAGARLAIHHAGTAEETSDAAAVVEEIQAMGGQAAAFAQDFTHDDAGHHLAAAVTAW